MASRIQVRQGTSSDRPVFQSGELGLDVDTGQVWIGAMGTNIAVGTRLFPQLPLNVNMTPTEFQDATYQAGIQNAIYWKNGTGGTFTRGLLEFGTQGFRMWSSEKALFGTNWYENFAFNYYGTGAGHIIRDYLLILPTCTNDPHPIHNNDFTSDVPTSMLGIVPDIYGGNACAIGISLGSTVVATSCDGLYLRSGSSAAETFRIKYDGRFVFPSGFHTPPASATAVGSLGEIRFGNDGRIYVCTATNTWIRSAAMSTW